MTGAARRLGVLFVRDVVLAWRNGQVAVVLAIMMLMGLLVAFLPARVGRESSHVIVDLTEGGWLKRDSGAAHELFAASREEMEDRLSADPRGVGVIASGGIDAPSVELIVPSSLSERNVAVVRAAVDELIRRARGSGSAGRFPVQTLMPSSGPVPIGLRGVPVFLIFEAGILGFLLVAVFLFQEKAEGTIRAYRVSPAGAASYVMAKAAVFLVMALLYGGGVVAVAAAKGARPDVPRLACALSLASATMTFLGLGFAAFFTNLSQWFFPGVGVLVLNIIPLLSYAMPSFDPVWLRAIPSYDVLFMARDALFAPGRRLDANALARSAAWLIGSAALCMAAVRARLMRESR